MTRDDSPASDYLWDRSGEPEAEVARLERLLGGLREHCPIPELGPLPAAAASRRPPALHVGLAVAAALALVLGAAALRVRLTPWRVTTLQGVAHLDRRPITSPMVVRSGQLIETDARSRARLQVGTIGHVDIQPGSRVRVTSANRREHRLALDHGRLSAVIAAPPRRFIVDTPGAAAIDLGCAYTLEVDAFGHATLRVEEGWVQLEGGGHEAIVPAGAAAHVRRGRGPGSPHYQDASEVFRAGLAAVDFGTEAEIGSALPSVLREARARDSLTLLSMLSRGGGPRRGEVYDRLAALLPPPRGVTREAVVKGDQEAIDAWWEALALERPRKRHPRILDLWW